MSKWIQDKQRPDSVEIEEYGTFHKVNCSECGNPLAYNNGWKDGATFCFDCTDALLRVREKDKGEFVERKRRKYDIDEFPEDCSCCCMEDKEED